MSVAVVCKLLLCRSLTLPGTGGTWRQCVHLYSLAFMDHCLSLSATLSTLYSAQGTSSESSVY